MLRDSLSRRGFLQIGSLGLGGLTLADVLRLKADEGKGTAAIDPGQGRGSGTFSAFGQASKATPPLKEVKKHLPRAALRRERK